MMHTLEEVRQEYDRLDRLCRVDTSRILLRKNNARRRLGSFCCRGGVPSGQMVITISQRALDSEELFLDTIRHEYAHAVVFLRHPAERHGHDAIWKAVCIEVGCVPRASAKTADLSDMEDSSPKYAVTCLQCGSRSFYFRAGSVVKLLQKGNGRKNSAGVICRRCGGSEFEFIRLR